MTTKTASNSSKSSSKSSKTTQEKNSTSSKTDPNQMQMLTLNVVHLLFLHGLCSNFKKVEELEKSMDSFLHDIIIIMEMYIDSANVSPQLAEKFNYKIDNDEKNPQTGKQDPQKQ